MLRHRITKYISLILAVILITGVFVSPASALELPKSFPKLANYYLDWDLTKEKIQKLSEWDVVIISNAAYSRYPTAVTELKSLNPKIVVLVYVVSNEATTFSTPIENGNLFKDIKEKVDSNDLWLYSAQKNKISTWPGAQWVNISSTSKTFNGQQYSQWLANEVTTRYLSNNVFDGVFYDNVFDNINWASGQIDIDNNGTNDDANFVNQKWQEGVLKLIQTTRALAPQKIIVANTNTNFYNDKLNGRLHEHFPRPQEGGWVGSLQGYLNNNIVNDPKLYIINANNNNVDNATGNLQGMRFTLGTTLLGDGYYSFTVGDQSHRSLWWYDEYNVFLGKALDAGVNIKTGTQKVETGVWRREYENGVVYINSTDTAQTITLETELEKIKGIQDPAFNNGAIIKKLTLNSKDGIVLQKRITTITNAPYNNGTFMKSFDKDGNQTQRNAFFVFDKSFLGNNTILLSDIENDGKYEKIVADKSKITVYNNDKTVRSSFYPYGTKYNFGITFDVGDVNGDGKQEIVTGTKKGFEPLVKIYSLDGKELHKGFHAYSKSYKGGVNVALADFKGNGKHDIVVGAGYFGGPQVRIFNGEGKVVSGGFFAYDKNFRGGVNVAAGDIDGDGKDEIITGAGVGGSSHVRMFNGKGELINPGFFAYDKTGRNGVLVFTADLDNDGKDEILAGNTNPF
ncbi:FG-GAP repeat protein [Candidatus Falkowbacteria bacterium]|nr:FG-GAP repeat protein [Candidatus Falkowbacteria bacterium]